MCCMQQEGKPRLSRTIEEQHTCSRMQGAATCLLVMAINTRKRRDHGMRVCKQESSLILSCDAGKL